MNKFQTYFGQIITDDELNEIFNSFALAIEQFIQDFNYYGLAVGGEVVQNPAPNLSVLVNGPLVAYDQNGNRITFAAPQIVNCAIDENNQPTMVQGSSNEKYLSIFIGFQSIPTDPREDELGEPLFFRYVGSHKLYITQGSEAPVFTAPRPALRGDLVLLADVRLTANQTSILTSDVRTDRTQVIFALPGTPLAIREKSLKPSMQAMVNAINAINTDTLIVPAIPGSPTSLSQGSVHAVFIQFLAAFNALVNQVNAGPDLSGVAHLTGSEEFTGTKTFNSINLKDLLFGTPTLATRGLLGTNTTPGDLNEKWLLIFDFKHTGGQYVKIYTGESGEPSGVGAFCIVVNAYWDATANNWVQRDNDYSSMALIFSYRRTRIAHKPANTTAPWAVWDDTLPSGATSGNPGVHITGEAAVNGAVIAGGNVRSGGQVRGATVVSDGSITGDDITGATISLSSHAQVGGNAVVSGNHTINGLLRLGNSGLGVSGGVAFTTPALRQARVSLSPGKSSIEFVGSTATIQPRWYYDTENDRWVAIRPGKLVIPLFIPLACYVERVYASFQKVPSANPPIFQLYNGTELSHSQVAGNRTNSEPAPVSGSNSLHLVADCINAGASMPNGMRVLSPGIMQLVVENPGWNYDPGGPFVQPMDLSNVTVHIRESGPGLWTSL